MLSLSCFADRTRLRIPGGFFLYPLNTGLNSLLCDPGSIAVYPNSIKHMSKEIRWRQRFQHFDRAVQLLREPIDRGVGSLSALEKEGTAQRFEMTIQLGWKTLKDSLQSQAAVLDPINPRDVIREAFAAGIITDGQIWIDMRNHRNLLSRTYDQEVLDEVITAIESTSMTTINHLHTWLTQQKP